ncbi:hypothetical protein JG687_00002226 [Phytophthora cactorum]|uniref:Uncharacterized protein n=1 Tax=Phytophthora cactorum TaxID=29920 RepID=A0A8T1UXK7_9STRA|nr:hypothetical protein JG687_00002226 [Phytophthora cactorum]
MSTVDELLKDASVSPIAKRMLEASPSPHLCDWSHVNCVRGESWFNDNFIKAFGVTLAAKYENNTTIFCRRFQHLRKTKGSFGRWERRRPCLHTKHQWKPIVVDKSKHKLYCYDSMDKRANRNLLGELADELFKKSLSHQCKIISVRSPIRIQLCPFRLPVLLA